MTTIKAFDNNTQLLRLDTDYDIQTHTNEMFDLYMALHRMNESFDPSLKVEGGRLMHSFYIVYGIDDDTRAWFAVTQAQRAIGFLCVAEHRNFTAKFAEIEGIYIKPGFQGRGFGRALVNEALNWCRSRLLLETRLFVSYNNVNAVDFYKRLGFDTLQLVMRIR